MYKYVPFKMTPPYSCSRPYGLLCKERRAGGWVTVALAVPFSGDREAVARLAERCTALRLGPEHLPDMVADFLSLPEDPD